MNKIIKILIVTVAVFGCAASASAFPRFHHGPHPAHFHHGPHPAHIHHHHGGSGLFTGLAIAGTAMAGAALVNDIVATQRAASQPQTVVVQQPVVAPQPVVIQQPVVVQQPAPVVISQPVTRTVTTTTTRCVY